MNGRSVDGRIGNHSKHRHQSPNFKGMSRLSFDRHFRIQNSDGRIRKHINPPCRLIYPFRSFGIIRQIGNIEGNPILKPETR